MKVFYRPEQTANVQTYGSPSMYKPERVVSDWKRRFSPEICAFEPVTRDQFYAVHSSEYVDGVLDLRLANGFGGREPEIASSLPYTSGSMVAAALCAFRENTITCSPTSGFHHAHHSHGGGFCTFNGLMVAALALLKAGARKVGIMDLDMHYGDGTQDIIDRLNLQERVKHYTLGEALRRTKGTEAAILCDIAQHMQQMVEAVDVILFQAGADSHIDDPLGGVFTTEGYRQRDQYVFATAQNQRVPVAWNLAGGYQNPLSRVVALHSTSYEEASCRRRYKAVRKVFCQYCRVSKPTEDIARMTPRACCKRCVSRGSRA